MRPTPRARKKTNWPNFLKIWDTEIWNQKKWCVFLKAKGEMLILQNSDNYINIKFA